MKKMTLFGLGLVAAGIVALVINLSFSSTILNLDDKHIVPGDRIQSMTVTSSSTPITITSSNQNEITISYHGEISEKLLNQYHLQINEDNEHLSVELTNKKNSTSSWFLFRNPIMNTRLEIFVPMKLYENLKISSSSGKISVSNLEAREITLVTSSGKIDVSNITAIEAMNFSTSSGKIEGNEIKTNEITSSSSSGATSLRDVLAEDLSITTSSGSVELYRYEGNLIVTSSSGKIEIETETLNNHIYATTTSGSVTINTKNKPTSAMIDFQGSSGKGEISVSGFHFQENRNNRTIATIGSEEILIKVRTSSGNFTFK